LLARLTTDEHRGIVISSRLHHSVSIRGRIV
jgi:hypothetical protein